MKKFITEKIKSINLKYLHIAIIVIGIIFISIPIFHSNLWFDESYSMALSGNHSFAEIWKIDGHDVHPVLYYFLLHCVELISGNSIIACRIFSMIILSILGILGYTHIRKDYGEKTGLIFSFLVFFLPTNVVYAGEIRMYTLAMLLATIAFIYACRIYKKLKEEQSKKDIIKNWAIFGISSLTLSYTHYYGLVTAGLINLTLFIYIIFNYFKATKNNLIEDKKQYKNNMIAFFIQAFIEVILYIPWLLQAFIVQLHGVSNGFWISGFNFQQDVPKMIAFQFTGNLETMIRINSTFAFIFGIIILAYLLILIIKNIKDKEIKMPLFAILLYIGVLVVIGIISQIIKPILYARYLLVITGIFILFISYMFTKFGNKWINIIFYSLIIVISVIVNINLVQTNYDKSNKEPIEFVKENVKEGDIIILGNSGSGFTMSIYCPNNMKYFFDEQHWNVEEAYKAYGSSMKTIYNLDELKDYKGRIWLFLDDNFNTVDTIKKNLNNINVISEQKYAVKYQNYKYAFALLEKD